jgi:hypothetical protein
MGWTFLRTASRSRIDIVRKEVEYETESITQRVIDHSEAGSTVYMLVERKPKPGVAWEPHHTYVNDPDGTIRWIAVFLTKLSSGSDYNFGYKDLDETMGPIECDCPKRIIAAASPLRDETQGYAGEWRRRCLENVEKKSAAKAKRNALSDGAKIKLNRPVRFTDGYVGDTFTARTINRRGRNLRVFVGQNGALYRVKGLQNIGYTIIS